MYVLRSGLEVAMAPKTDLIVNRPAEKPVCKLKSYHQSTETDARGWDTRKIYGITKEIKLMDHLVLKKKKKKKNF